MISRRGFLTWPLTLFGFGTEQDDETVIVDGIVLEDGMHYIKAQRDKTHTSGWRIWVEPEPRLSMDQVNPPDLLVVDDPGFVGFGRLNNVWIDELLADRITRITAHHK